jgi:hypothetical protein
MAMVGVQARPLVPEGIARTGLVRIQRMLHEPGDAIDNRIFVAAGAAQRPVDNMVCIFQSAAVKCEPASTLRTDDQLQ